jgi:hypothetical protein
MDKRIFDFTDEPALQALPPDGGELTVLAGIDGFALLATAPDGRPVALREWVFDQTGRSFGEAEMDVRRIFGSEALLGRRYAAVRCALFNAGATLVPRRLFRADDDMSLHFRLLLAPGEYVYGYDDLPEGDAVVVWAVEPVLLRLCEHYFPGVRCNHLAAPLLRAFRQQASADGTEVMINLRNQVAQVTVYERRNLVFYNTYFFRHANDLLYFALLAYDQFRLRPAEVPLVLAGNLVEESDVYRQLHRYIRHLRFARLPVDVTLPEGARALPAHCHFDIFSIKGS